ncbi:MAG: lipopolysaccharide transport periplasmic protein LptA [Succinivibrionaceae bacterium]|nr:lipopolysaccharide transport periplasmic protein LptA [Succinivibrionaceae bacterium]
MRLSTRKILTAAASVALMWGAGVAGVEARQSDLKERITIDSDSQQADMNDEHIVFVSNVVISQGTIRITADRVEVFRENKAKNQHSRLQALGSDGRPAVYEELLDDGTRVHAEGRTLSYDLTDKFILVEGGAYVRKHDNEIRGSRITYDMRKSQMNATSSPGAGRVHTVLIPEQLEQKKEQKKNSGTGK